MLRALPAEGLSLFAEDPSDELAIEVLSANSETVGTLRTTCVPTMLTGGHAENALPQSATATVNCRIYPGEGVKLTQERLEAAIGNDQIDVALMQAFGDSPISNVPEGLEPAIRTALTYRFPDITLVPYMESGGTDGMHYRNVRIDTIGISGRGYVAEEMFAHGLNERLRVKEFYDGLDYWLLLLTELSK